MVEDDDKYFNMVERIVDDADKINTPGRFPVEAIPSLRYLPSWFPGAGFKRQAEKWRKVTLAMARVPFAFVKDQMVGLIIIAGRV